MSEMDKAKTKAEQDKFYKIGKVFLYISWLLAPLSLLLWIISEFRNEPAWRMIPFGLFVFWCLLQFILV